MLGYILILISLLLVISLVLLFNKKSSSEPKSFRDLKVGDRVYFLRHENWKVSKKTIAKLDGRKVEFLDGSKSTFPDFDVVSYKYDKEWEVYYDPEIVSEILENRALELIDEINKL